MTYSKLGTDTQTGERVDIFKLSRLLGLYIVGLQGMGKSGLLEELIVQDMKQDIGVCVLDPHGELVDNIIARLPDEKKEEKVIYLDLAESQYFFGLNIFSCPDPTSERSIAEARSQVLHVFEKAFGISPSTPLMYDLLHKIASVLIANPGYTMADISLFLTNETCRKALIQTIARADIQGFWERWDDPKLKVPRDREEDSRTILNKLNDFEDEPLRYIIGQSASTIDLRKIMDEGKILLVKLDRQREQATSLIGSILVAQILNAANTRQTNKLFNLYADEFQNFATEDFAILLEQARKRGIGVTMAHQNRAQLELSNRQADKNLKARTLNVGNLVVFRVPTDAEELAKQFQAVPKSPDIIGQEPVMVRATSGVFERLMQGHPNQAVMRFIETYVFPDPRKWERREHDPIPVLSPGYWLGGSLPLNTGTSVRFDRWQAIAWQNRMQEELKKLLDTVNAKSDPTEIFPISVALLRYIGDVSTPSEYFQIRPYVPYIDETGRRCERWITTKVGLVTSDMFGPTVHRKDDPRDVNIDRVFNTFLSSPDGRFNPAWVEAIVAETCVCLKRYLIEIGQRECYGSAACEKAVARAEVDKQQVRLGLIEYFRTYFQQLDEPLIILRDALRGLAQEPIMVDTGRFIPKYGPEETIANAQARVATELVRLPKFTARVKLSDGSGNPDEHIIQTFAPGKGLYGQALKQRQERIRQRNIRDGYLKDRAKVEGEIIQRQQRAVQPLPVGGNKPAPFPSAQRKALLCSSCGASNQSGAKFCNQCGTRI